jgi:hypothetical protein
MDIDDDDTMIHQLRQDKSNAASDDDEHLTILACLIQLQAGKLKNAALKRGGKSLEKEVEAKVEDGLSCIFYMPTILPRRQHILQGVFGSAIG